MHRPVFTALLFAVGLVACGGSDASTDAESDQASNSTADVPTDSVVATDAPTSSDSAPTALVGVCPSAPFVVDFRAANAYSDLEPFEDPAHPFTDAVAVKISESAYTLYIADFDLDPAYFKGSYSPPAPPTPDANLVTVFVTAFNAPDPSALPPIEVGTVVPTSSDTTDGMLTFGVIMDRTSGSFNSAPRAEGELTVTGLSSLQFCADIDYVDYEDGSVVDGVPVESPVQKRFVGSVAADVVEYSY